MLWDFADYSDSDSEPLLSLLLSERSIDLVLAAMKEMDKRHNWTAEDDSTWDTIHAALGEAYDELMSEYMPDFTLVGTIVAYAGVLASIPDKWLLCDGAILDVDDYPDLRDVLDTPFDDNTFLYLPDLRSQFIYGASFNSDLGDTGGADTHTLTTAEIPAHTHTVARGNAIGNNASFVVEADGSTPSFATQNTGSTGSGGSHNNMPPYMKLFYIIKVLP